MRLTAVIIGALYIHGLKPGPMLLVETPHLFLVHCRQFSVGKRISANFWSDGHQGFHQDCRMSQGDSDSLIIILSSVGAYAIQNNPVDIYWMLLFGVIGYFFKTYGFQVGPIILGVILGPMIDSNYRRAMIGARGDIGTFFWDFASHPDLISAVSRIFAMLLSQTPLWPVIKSLFGAKIKGFRQVRSHARVLSE